MQWLTGGASGIERCPEYCYIPVWSVVCLRPGQIESEAGAAEVYRHYSRVWTPNAQSLSGKAQETLPKCQVRPAKEAANWHRKNWNRAENRRAISQRITATQGRAVQLTNTTWDPGTCV